MKTSYFNGRQFFLIVLLQLLVNSCDSFVEVDLPKSQLNNVSVFEDYATANAALTDVYSKIRDKGMLTGIDTGLSNELGNYTDEIIPFGTPSNSSFNFYNTNLLADNAEVTEYWNATYNQIYALNAVIEGLEASTILSEKNKTQLLGEALFLRALLHFYLVNIFGDIPYIKITDYNKNKIVSRLPTALVYQNIVSDLENSISLLPYSYSSPERIRPSKNVANAFLSRVYLYMKSYAEASNSASSIINQSELFELEQNTNKVFLLNSKETIWQLQSSEPGQNTLEAITFIFESGPPLMLALNTNLVQSFSTTDLRKSSWIKTISDGTSTWYHAYKYKEQNFTSVSKEYSIVLRLAEQYLIRAEARAHQGDLIGAKEDLNTIRHRAGLEDSSATTQLEILDAILQERRWELFTEHGHRFFDLKRFNKIDSVISAIKPGWNTNDALFPIPQNEISTNPNLRPQNPGY